MKLVIIYICIFVNIEFNFEFNLDTHFGHFFVINNYLMLYNYQSRLLLKYLILDAHHTLKPPTFSSKYQFSLQKIWNYSLYSLNKTSKIIKFSAKPS